MTEALLKKGKLIYIPSNVILFDTGIGKGILRSKETAEPTHALCLGRDESSEHFLRILHEGEQWSVHQRDVAEVSNVN